MAKAGRKTKLTPELKEQLIKYIEAGNYVKDACNMVGIHRATCYRWIKRGEKAGKKLEEGKKLSKKENEFCDFCDTIKKARSKAIMRNVLIIQTAAKKTWQAAAWWLERAHYKDWGIKKQIGGTGEEPIKIEIKNKDLEKELMDELNKMAERYKKKKKGK